MPRQDDNSWEGKPRKDDNSASVKHGNTKLRSSSKSLAILRSQVVPCSFERAKHESAIPYALERGMYPRKGDTYGRTGVGGWTAHQSFRGYT